VGLVRTEPVVPSAGPVLESPTAHVRVAFVHEDIGVEAAAAEVIVADHTHIPSPLAA
jgi:hypothetical protein